MLNAIVRPASKAIKRQTVVFRSNGQAVQARTVRTVFRFPQKIRPAKVETPEKRLERVMKFRSAVIAHLEHHGVEFEVDDDLTFPEGPATIKGAFGTPQRPALIPSHNNMRAVGCTGGSGAREHDLLWHNVKRDRPTVCLDCGQSMRLVSYDEWLEWAAGEFEKGVPVHKWYHEV